MASPTETVPQHQAQLHAQLPAIAPAMVKKTRISQKQRTKIISNGLMVAHLSKIKYIMDICEGNLIMARRISAMMMPCEPWLLVTSAWLSQSEASEVPIAGLDQASI